MGGAFTALDRVRHGGGGYSGRFRDAVELKTQVSSGKSGDDGPSLRLAELSLPAADRDRIRG